MYGPFFFFFTNISVYDTLLWATIYTQIRVTCLLSLFVCWCLSCVIASSWYLYTYWFVVVVVFVYASCGVGAWMTGMSKRGEGSCCKSLSRTRFSPFNHLHCPHSRWQTEDINKHNLSVFSVKFGKFQSVHMPSHSFVCINPWLLCRRSDI